MIYQQCRIMYMQNTNAKSGIFNSVQYSSIQDRFGSIQTCSKHEKTTRIMHLTTMINYCNLIYFLHVSGIDIDTLNIRTLPG